jgi:hypothetical protein
MRSLPLVGPDTIGGVANRVKMLTVSDLDECGRQGGPVPVPLLSLCCLAAVFSYSRNSLRGGAGMSERGSTWQELFDWTAKHQLNLLAIPHVRKVGATTKVVDGQEVPGLWIGIDSVSRITKRDVVQQVHELFGSEVWVDVHYTRRAIMSEKTLN